MRRGTSCAELHIGVIGFIGAAFYLHIHALRGKVDVTNPVVKKSSQAQ